MWIVAIFCVAGFLLWQSSKRRAQRFVRSVFFLEIIDSGASTDTANGQVARLFTKHSSADKDNAAIRHAMDKANRLTDGKQLPWIQEAREKGFAIDSGDSRIDMAHLAQSQSRTNPDQNFTGHFSEGEYIQPKGAQFPHALPGLSEAYHVGLEHIEANKGKLVPTIKAVARIGIRWALWGAVAGFAIGLVIPRVGVFSSLELWAVPVVTAYVGAMAGIAIGTVCWAVRWVYGH
ncbi:hypothetical protein [Sulfitobacter donghicola]|uniref:Uncharacterized protein n=1 Tax=Sulfitobacter donghicola DSW-25 = KCTC 12864 = JCM 14565 TaxID=1300350 RepID=A0A073IFB0_9RHOB|nr:hypothetical protein [Sulfitobacter donghicola]KEJ88186.1 hypothetical protein DSW25_16050 [Sulfitobacter donghicola DSW-25 = KCTC 12864 = JCM 14565]KIN68776.1 hypothetical protein Z948_2508 [Sulfitobacter donghicola DSW-25 = KCTC 12864 = JCM 14565]